MNRIQEVTVNKLSKFVELISKRFLEITPNNFYEKDKLLFRGQDSSTYGLIPSIYREIGQQSQDRYLRFEFEIIHQAKLRNPDEFGKIDMPFNELAKLQHYGVPTRLLDLTENALVALYFACLDSKEENDGEVFCFRVENKNLHNALSPVPNMISMLSHFSEYTIIPIDQVIKLLEHENFYQRYAKDNSHEAKTENIITVFSQPRFVMPSLISEREKRQQAVFMIFPNIINNKEESFKYFTDEMTNVKANQTSELQLIIKIPKENKKTILKELNMFGVNNRFLYPELEHECKHIKEHFSGIVSEYTE